jgi:hypothetical protein
MLPVCQAVQHAHQKGIIHRDLKPGNILVCLTDGKPVPKVIDFGVAKAMGAKLTDQTLYTAAGAVIGTVEYMAPEQARVTNLDIDTRADIYSLGAVLYELLAGSPPFSRRELRSAALDEVLRMVREQEPPKPSTKLSTADELASLAAVRGIEPRRLKNLVRGDLDWIVMKCLEKDRGRRYETANSLAMDIQHYLADQPVLAGPPSKMYRLKKFLRRNRTAITTTLLSLSILVVIAAWATRNWLVQKRTEADLAFQKEMTQNFAAAMRWMDPHGRFYQIQTWLRDSGEAKAKATEEPVRLSVDDRDRLRRAMLEEVVGIVEDKAPIELKPNVTIALLNEAGVRALAGRACAELEAPARGVRHLRRSIEIYRYLQTPASGISPENVPIGRHAMAMNAILLLDLCERANMLDSIGTELSLAEEIFPGTPETDYEGSRLKLATPPMQSAFHGVKGALLGRRGDFAAGEKLLLIRFSALTDPEQPAEEILPVERQVTAQRLADLYSAWKKPDEAARWKREVEKLKGPAERKTGE